MSGIIAQSEQPEINSGIKAKENLGSESRFCSVCFCLIGMEFSGIVKCKGCGIIAEKQCVQDLLHLPNDFVFETWQCPVCSQTTINLDMSTATK